MSRNIALVGCGAIAQLLYVPVLAKRRKDFDQVWLVDPSEHARTLASAAIDSVRAVSALQDVTDDIEFAVIAAPNGLHFTLARDALMRGAHVLIEKPFVLTPGDGVILQEVAATHNRAIAVNQTRRFFPLARELRQRVRNGEFGKFKSAVHFEGVKLSWPFESGAAFAPRAYRTGVIMDFGVHVIDFYHFLLEPDWDVTSAVHDGFHGPEGLAKIEITASGAPITIRLSRYYQQQNEARLSFDRAEVWADVYNLDTYWVKVRGQPARAFRAQPQGLSYDQLADSIIGNLLAAGEGRESAVCDAASSLPVIRLLDKIYDSASVYPAQCGLV